MEEIEYKVVEKESEAQDTEKMLNGFAEQGWRVVCSYCYGGWFVLSRTKSNGGKSNGRRKN